MFLRTAMIPSLNFAFPSYDKAGQLNEGGQTLKEFKSKKVSIKLAML
jgi:hypothetical protein